MSTSFSDFDLHPKLIEQVADLGYSEPTPIQAALMPVMLQGRDVIGRAQTGTGKTAAFTLPMLSRLDVGSGKVQGLVLAPTRELAKQVADAVYRYGNNLGMRVLPIYGGTSYGKQIRRLKKGVDVVVGTPGRLLDLIKKGALDLSAVHTAVLDEADEMLSMGFIDDIDAILSATSPNRQTALLSATLPDGMRRLAKRHMDDPVSCKMEGDNRTAATVDQRHYVVRHHDRDAALLRLLETEPVDRAIVFARTRKDTAQLADRLHAAGYAAGALHGGMEQPERRKMLERFKSGRVKVLVGTDVASRGLDIEEITHVFNYILPRDPQVYVHRVGRTGRAGREGTAITLVSRRERKQLRKVERYTKEKIREAQLPTREEVEAHRDAIVAEELSEILAEGNLEREATIINALVDAGFEPSVVAAAALKMARGPEAVQEIEPPRKRRDSGSHGKPKRSSHEDGMVRVSLDVGRKNGTRPGHIVGSIAHFAQIPGKVLGKISIQERNTYVDVPTKYADRVLAQSGNLHIGQNRVQAERA